MCANAVCIQSTSIVGQNEARNYDVSDLHFKNVNCDE